MTADLARPAPYRPRHARPRRLRVIRWIVVAVVLVLLAVAAWIIVRGMLARDALMGAVPLVRSAQAAVLAGETEDVQGTLTELQERTAQARALTSDPVWRVAEFIPIAGANLTAFREAAGVVDDVVSEALPPLAQVASQLDLSVFVPSDGAVDVSALTSARPLLAEGAAAMSRAVERAESIDTSHTVPQIGIAVDQLIDLVLEADGLVSGVAGAAEILPAMLGYEDGPRSYILLALNNAELRAAGGIPGALAEIRVENGTLTLGEQTSAVAFGRRDEALPLTAVEEELYTDNLGLFVQNVTATPWFHRSAELTVARWEERYGERPDGVLSVDPVALSYILTATGPIEVTDGVTLDADTVVQTLLSDVYARYDDPQEQDAFFSRTFERVFERLASGNVEPKRFVDAVARAASERRILVWSAHEDEQEIISEGAISGHPPLPSDEEYRIGVYFHDTTESKMDWYLRSAITVSSVECRNDDRPFYEVRVHLSSNAPADVSTIPGYVTGSRYEPGQTRTGVFLFVPAGSDIYDARSDGEPAPWASASDDAYEIAVIQSTLEPGEDVVLTFHVLGPAGAPLAVAVEHTPTAFTVPVSVGNVMACPSVLTEHEQVALPFPPDALAEQARRNMAGLRRG